MTEDEFLIKYQNFLNGSASPEEIAELKAYQDDIELEDDVREMDSAEADIIKTAIAARLRENMGTKTVRIKPVWWSKWKVAAVVAGLALGLCYFQAYLQPQEKHPGQLAAAPSTGKNEKKIYLTLGNGKKISLTDAGKGTITKTSGVEVNKETAGELAYQHNQPGTNPAGVPEINTVSTPGGIQFSITLADGSKVRLNASSSLRFPAFFNSNKREVYLTGEAFFEVVADPTHPFIVHINEEEVQALGTSFNIKAYAEEKRSKTTLVSGAVNVKLPAAVKPLRIGQQLQYSYKDHQAFLNTVNTETVTAWKDGFIAFDNERLEDIMLEIGRWYNMKVVFAAGNISRKFSGKINRSKNINEVCKTLEYTGAMKFNIINNQIVVNVP